jgi:hypothetical protein
LIAAADWPQAQNGLAGCEGENRMGITWIFAAKPGAEDFWKMGMAFKYSISIKDTISTSRTMELLIFVQR